MANDSLTSGAWVNVRFNDLFLVSTSPSADPISFLSTDSNSGQESSESAYIPRLVKTNRASTNHVALQVRVGYGDQEINEYWSIVSYASAINSIGASIAGQLSFSDENTRIGFAIDANTNGLDPVDWRVATFAFDVPTAEIIPGDQSNASRLRTGLRVGPHDEQPFFWAALPGVAASLSPSTKSGRTAVVGLPGFNLIDCAIPDGPFWHEQVLVDEGALAVEGKLHKLRVVFNDPLPGGGINSSVFGRRFTPGGFGQTQTGFFTNPTSFFTRFLNGVTVEFLPVFSGKKLFPTQYVSGVVETPSFSYSTVVDGILGETRPADYDLRLVLHMWCQTAIIPNDFERLTSLSFTVQSYNIWTVRATMGGWSGNRQFVRYAPPVVATATISDFQRLNLLAGNSETSILKAASNGLSYLNADETTVTYTLEEYVPS